MITHDFAGPHLAGLQIVPPALVWAARSALAAQGVDSNVISGSGEIDAAALIALAFDKIEIRSRAAPPLVISLKGGTPDPATQALLQRVQPAVILSGRAGRFEIAPYGNPSGIDPSISAAGTQLGIGIGAALLGLFAIGYIVLGR